MSPSSLRIFEDNKDKFVQIYMCDPGLPRDAQTPQMAVGSSFDAFVKNELCRCIHGGESVLPGKQFHLETLFNKQVDEHKDYAWETGGALFLKYKDSGAFDELLCDIKGATDIAFEALVTATIFGVPFRGYPDFYYTHRNLFRLILDWKVNNSNGSRKMSPLKYYISDRPRGKAHKDVTLVDYNGLQIQDRCFSETSPSWTDQTCIYHWMLGGEVGLVQIEQILCAPHTDDTRIVTYRSQVSKEYQEQLEERIRKAWEAIDSGHIYQDLSREENDERLNTMQKYCLMKQNSNPILDVLYESN